MKFCDLTKELLLKRFPEFSERVSEVEHLCSDLPHVLFGLVFSVELPVLLKTEDDHEHICRVFEFYEELAEGDEETQNLLQVSLLEFLWNEEDILYKAQRYMHEKTKEINKRISDYLINPMEH